MSSTGFSALQGLRMELLEALGYNSSLAEALGTAHAMTGSWRTIPDNLRRADAMTSSDIQEVPRHRSSLLFIHADAQLCDDRWCIEG